jgi:hypothetical protein
MSSVLARPPLRTNLSMIEGHDFDVPLPVDHDGQPFAYLFAEWNPGDPSERQDLGYYDEEMQVWVTPTGDITLGVYTKTSTGAGCSGADCVTDDACF